MFNTARLLSLFSINATQTQLAGLDYISQHAQSTDYIVTDNYFFLNLRFNPDMSNRYPSTQWYTKVDQDPFIQAELFERHNNTIDWLLLDDMITSDIQNGVSPILAQAKKTAVLDKQFSLDATHEAVANLYQQAPYTIEPISIYQTKSATDKLAGLNSTQLLGRLIWISLTSPNLTATQIGLLNKQLASGVVIQKSAITDSNQLDALIQQIHQAAGPTYRPVIAISFEGGLDTPIPWLNGMNPGSLKSITEAAEMASTRANQLKKIGFNTILGPIIDLRRKDSIYDQNNLVPTNADFSQKIAHTYQESGLIPFVRWFPGSLSGDDTSIWPPPSSLHILQATPNYLAPYTQFFKNNLYPAGIMVGAFTFENSLILPNLIVSL